jgi:hypothetical protein
MIRCVSSKPKGSLSSVLVRIERAKAHLIDFERQAKPIPAECKVTREVDESTSEYVFRVSHVPPIPAELSAIIGDAIHNLRVSLDYLAWQLVIATGTKPPDDHTGFPVLTIAPTADRWGRTRPNISPGVSKDVRALLDDIQPYKRDDEPVHHDLAILHALDINDKHHELLVAIVGSFGMGYWGDAPPMSGPFNVGPYTEGDEICRFTSSGTINFDPMMMFEVRLNEPVAGYKGQSLRPAELVRLQLRYVEDEVLPRFRGFLGS